MYVHLGDGSKVKISSSISFLCPLKKGFFLLTIFPSFVSYYCHLRENWSVYLSVLVSRMPEGGERGKQKGNKGERKIQQKRGEGRGNTKQFASQNGYFFRDW